MSTTPGSAAMSISVQSTYCTVVVPTELRHGTPGCPAYANRLSRVVPLVRLRTATK